MANALQPVATEQEEEDSNEAWLLAWALLLLLLGGNAARAIPIPQRRRARNMLRAKFDNDMGRLAVGVTGGSLTSALWLTDMQDTIDNYARQMAVAGAGTLPNARVRATVWSNLLAQRPFLQRFGGVVAAGALTVGAIASRSILYGGTGWSAYWQGTESVVPQQRGEIVHYIARDDQGTCSPCSEAQRNGPYIADGNHPWPGSVCRGGGRCRCELRYEFNPGTYARLTGRGT